MTRQQLLQKHPKLTEIASSGVFDDVANHLRRLNPFINQMGQQFDAAGIARHAGRLEGWLAAVEVLQTVHMPLPEMKQPEPAKPYSEPATKGPEIVK